MSFTKRALKKVTIFDKVKKFITQARSQDSFLLVHQKGEGGRVGREPGNELFFIEVLGYFSSMLNNVTERTWICGTLTSPPYSSVIG